MSLKESIKRVPLVLPTWRWMYRRTWFRNLVDDLIIMRLHGRMRPDKLVLPGGNHWMYVDPRENRGRAILMCQAHGQSATKELWRRAVEALDPTIVLDVGLNYGEIVLSQRYRADARIIGIEANAQLMPCLEKSRREHPNAAQMEFHCALASDRSDAQSEFFVNRRWSGSSSAIRDESKTDIERREVKTLAIDALVAGKDLSEKSLLFKIDVEGYEPPVLRGMQRLLAECRRWVGIIEFNTNYLAKLGVDIDEYLGGLSAQADLFAINQQGRIQVLDAASPRKSLDKDARGQPIEVDLLLISHWKHPRAGGTTDARERAGMSSQVANESPVELPAAPRSTAARSTLGVLVTKLATVPLAIATTILVARYLGPADRGAYAFLMLPHTFYFPLSTLGFGASILYLISSGRYGADGVAVTCLAVGAAFGLANAAILGALWHFDLLGDTARSVPQNLMIAILLLLPMQGALMMAQRVLLGASRYALSNYLLAGTSALSAVLLLALVVAADLGLFGAVAALVITNIIIGIVTCYLVCREFRPCVRLDGGFVASGLHYGSRAWIGEATTRLNLRLDQAILSFAPASALGMYSVAVAMSEFLWHIPDSLGYVLFNRIAAEKRPELRAALVQRVHRTIIVLMALLALLLAAVSPWLVPFLFGEAYEGTVEPLVLLLPGTVALVTTKILTKFFGGSGMPGRSSAITAIGTVVGVALFAALIPAVGIRGAAIATSMGYIATAVASVILFRRVVPTQTRLFGVDRDDVRWLIAQFRSLRPRSNSRRLHRRRHARYQSRSQRTAGGKVTCAKILFNITHGFQARMSLRSKISETLLAQGVELIVVSPNADEEYFRREFDHPQIQLEKMPSRFSRVWNRCLLICDSIF